MSTSSDTACTDTTAKRAEARFVALSKRDALNGAVPGRGVRHRRKSLNVRSQPLSSTCKPLQLSHAPRSRPESLWAQGRPWMQDPTSATGMLPCDALPCSRSR